MVTIKVCLHGHFAPVVLMSINGTLLFSLSETCQAAAVEWNSPAIAWYTLELNKTLGKGYSCETYEVWHYE